MAHINLQKIVSVKGQAGLFHLANYNAKGYFLQPFEGGATRFFSNEKGKVLAVGNVDLKVKGGSISSLDIFLKMKDEPTLPVDSDKLAIEDYFKKLIPNLDDKVASSHLDKIHKWFHFISTHHNVKNMVNEEDDGLTIA